MTKNQPNKSGHKVSRRQILFLISAGAAWCSSWTGLLADDPLSIRKARRRITPLCSIPPADYQFGSRSPSVVMRSLPAIDQLSMANVEQIVQSIRSTQTQLDALGALGLDDELLKRFGKRDNKKRRPL